MLFYCICKSLTFSTLYPHSTLSHLIHTSSSTATRPTPFGLSLTHTRGRNAHKKRANIRRKSEFAKVLALIFKHLAYFALFFSHTKCWHTIRPTLQIERKPSQNTPHDYTTRDAHIAHHPLSYNLMLTRPNNTNHTAKTASESNITPFRHNSTQVQHCPICQNCIRVQHRPLLLQKHPGPTLPP